MHYSRIMAPRGFKIAMAVSLSFCQVTNCCLNFSGKPSAYPQVDHLPRDSGNEKPPWDDDHPPFFSVQKREKSQAAFKVDAVPTVPTVRSTVGTLVSSSKSWGKTKTQRRQKERDLWHLMVI